jgi:hypothetical protein
VTVLTLTPWPHFPTFPPPIDPAVNDAQLESMMNGISDARLSRALGPRLDVIIAEHLEALLAPRLRAMVTEVFDTHDPAPMIERHLDTMHHELETTWQTRIDTAVESQGAILRDQARRSEADAIRSINTVTEQSFSEIGVATAMAQTLVEQMDERYLRLQSLGTDLTVLIDQNTDFLDQQDAHSTQLADLEAALHHLQSDTVRHSEFHLQLNAVQVQLLNYHDRLTRDSAGTANKNNPGDPDGPPHYDPTGPADPDEHAVHRARVDRDRKKFRDHDGPTLLNLLPATMRVWYTLLSHICHNCRLPLKTVAEINSNTDSLCPESVPGPEYAQHSMALYFKLTTPGVLPKTSQTAAWLRMFSLSADGYGLLFQLMRHAIPALSATIPIFPTWTDYPNVYGLM